MQRRNRPTPPTIEKNTTLRKKTCLLPPISLVCSYSIHHPIRPSHPRLTPSLANAPPSLAIMPPTPRSSSRHPIRHALASRVATTALVFTSHSPYNCRSPVRPSHACRAPSLASATQPLPLSPLRPVPRIRPDLSAVAYPSPQRSHPSLRHSGPHLRAALPPTTAPRPTPSC